MCCLFVFLAGWFFRLGSAFELKICAVRSLRCGNCITEAKDAFVEDDRLTTVPLISLLIWVLATMSRVGSYHALMSFGTNRLSNLVPYSGFPRFSDGRGGESAGGAPRG
ncbi:hypothetical protein F511_32786 [Dorcoceras hygrometricum]|uniref:Secreted protein n=1 Tax=Dorcoceras hygrometricum TaxID=472368 RepID=A0A2Z7BLG3_9LAMI|nr:hypothetical protein F511_32786 [Dorcoceras hygrometricum]